MRAIILMMVLAVLGGCGKAASDWVQAGSRTGAITAYANPSTILKTGNTVEMSALFDYAAAQTVVAGKPFMSSRAQYEYGCKEKQNRRIAVSWYSEKMGGGREVFRHSSPGKWEPVMPGSLNDALFEIACRKQAQ